MPPELRTIDLEVTELGQFGKHVFENFTGCKDTCIKLFNYKENLWEKMV
jgi:hypothetical protein